MTTSRSEYDIPLSEIQISILECANTLIEQVRNELDVRGRQCNWLSCAMLDIERIVTHDAKAKLGKTDAAGRTDTISRQV